MENGAIWTEATSIFLQNVIGILISHSHTGTAKQAVNTTKHTTQQRHCISLYSIASLHMQHPLPDECRSDANAQIVSQSHTLTLEGSIIILTGIFRPCSCLFELFIITVIEGCYLGSLTDDAVPSPSLQ